MPDKKFDLAVDRILLRDTRYAREGYVFTQEALAYTQDKIQKTGSQTRHVTGQELLGGIREYALGQFASMTVMVLGEWGITHCEDFGEIVFNMVEEGILSKTEEDSRKDFTGGFDFYDAFSVPFLPPSARASKKAPWLSNG